VLSLVLLTAPEAVPPLVTFNASRAQLDVAGIVRLRWSIENATSVYISGIGVVSATGEREVEVSATTTFWLLAEGTDGVASKQVTVAVRGSRGTDIDVSRIAYVRQLEDNLPAADLATLIDHLKRLLQETLRSPVSGPLTEENTTVLRTDLADSPALVTPAESAIGARRVSYQIRIFSTGRAGQYHYSMSTAIQYRRKIERSWYWESASSPLHRQAADALRARIAAQHLAG
jgi:hypothetical protein